MTSAADGHPFANPASPPTKASLTTWWEKFKGKGNPKKEEPKEAPGIFGVPLQESIKYAKVAISMNDQNGNSFIYGHIPIVIAKCGVFLKDKATDVEGIFRLSGSAKRIKDLQVIFNSPDKYGKGLDWTGYTVHDAANILRRYLNQLPEPIIPLDYYDRFRQPLQGKETVNDAETIKTYQRLINELPPLNRQLLLYILDLLAVFSSKSEANLMPAANLAAIFQPGIISHPDHEMSPADYRLSQDVLIFLILNQDNFLLGMRGPDDEEAKVPNEGYQPSALPSRNPSSKRSLDRHPSNGSAGAESNQKFGIKRRASTSSKKSVSSPILGGIGLSRSNTLPSKNRSPSATTPTFQPRTPQSPRVPPSPSFQHTSSNLIESISPDTEIPEENAVEPPKDPAASSKKDEVRDSRKNLEVPGKGEKSTSEFSELVSPVEPTSSSSSNPPKDTPNPQGMDQPATPQPLLTPTKEKGFASYFTRSPGSDAEKKTSNKLRKKRIPGSQNASAESSTASLNGNAAHPPSTVIQSIPPTANPTSQQPPLLPISASPPTSSDNNPLSDPLKPPSQTQNGLSISTETPVKPTGTSAHMTVPHSKGAQSASTSSLVHEVSQTSSHTPSLSSNSSQNEDGKPAEKPKHKSIWRKSAQKLNLGGATQAASEKLSGLMSPPFTKSQHGNGSTNSLNSKGRRRSQSVGEKAGDMAKKETSALPQRGASASGQHGQNVESVGAIGWLNKKMNERKDKGKDTLSPAQVPLPVTTPTQEANPALATKQ
ncbi:Oligophrenin-1 [Dactylella cylindrospora]|nr:Oligophrenin-1 [Dactylella cylindrospora]